MEECRVVLRDLFEAYKNEEIQLRSGKNMYATKTYRLMVLLAEKKCKDLSVQKIYLLLCDDYRKSPEEIGNFLEYMLKDLRPYVVGQRKKAGRERLQGKA